MAMILAGASPDVDRLDLLGGRRLGACAGCGLPLQPEFPGRRCGYCAYVAADREYASALETGEFPAADEALKRYLGVPPLARPVWVHRDGRELGPRWRRYRQEVFGYAPGMWTMQEHPAVAAARRKHAGDPERAVRAAVSAARRLPKREPWQSPTTPVVVIPAWGSRPDTLLAVCFTKVIWEGAPDAFAFFLWTSDDGRRTGVLGTETLDERGKLAKVVAGLQLLQWLDRRGRTPDDGGEGDAYRRDMLRRAADLKRREPNLPRQFIARRLGVPERTLRGWEQAKRLNGDQKATAGN